MQQILLIIHVLVSIAIVSLVLVQHGKGADIGASFGSGSANTMFGSRGHISFLMKLTTLLAAVFFVTSLSLSYLASHAQKTQDFLTTVPKTTKNQGDQLPAKSISEFQNSDKKK